MSFENPVTSAPKTELAAPDESQRIEDNAKAQQMAEAGKLERDRAALRREVVSGEKQVPATWNTDSFEGRKDLEEHLVEEGKGMDNLADIKEEMAGKNYDWDKTVERKEKERGERLARIKAIGRKIAQDLSRNGIMKEFSFESRSSHPSDEMESTYSFRLDKSRTEGEFVETFFKDDVGRWVDTGRNELTQEGIRKKIGQNEDIKSYFESKTAYLKEFGDKGAEQDFSDEYVDRMAA